MKYIAKSSLILSIIISFLYQPKIQVIELILIFLLVSVTVLTETNNKTLEIAALTTECILLFFIGNYTEYLHLALLVLLFDCIYSKRYYFAAVIVVFSAYFGTYSRGIEYYLIVVLVGIISYSLRKDADNKTKYYRILDGERRTKYELEIAKASLIKSNTEVEKLAKAKERNRIARDVHDNIGHSIAGILIKLQATKKVLQQDTASGNKMLDECIVHLQNSLQILRDTVHNMYSTEKRGVDYIKSIVEDYRYCEAKITANGDFSACSSRVFQALSYVLKEALTNIAKHSKATSVEINLKKNDKAIKMKIADNGIGFSEIKEGLGIRSMRERIKGLGGKFIIDGHSGMNISCEIPISGENK